MIKLPRDTNNVWSQPNTTDKFGSLWYTKNINLDEEGYIKLSPRSVQIFDEIANTDFDVPVMFGRYGDGDYVIPTTDSVFNADISTAEITFTENTGTNNPASTARSHGIIWKGRILVSTDTTVLAKDVEDSAGTTWDEEITSLTGSVRHYFIDFKSRIQLCVTNGNIVKQYSESGGTYTNTIDLTIPADFELIGGAYNNNQVGFITRLGSDSIGQNQEAYFFIWRGDSTEADGGWGVGSEACIAICPYKSSFLILTKAGQLKYFNGGGFEDLASFPFYFTDRIWGGLLNLKGRGDLMMADGDIVYINLSLELEEFGRKEERHLPQAPSGVWCYDPALGAKGSLYHRYSPSISQAYSFAVTDANVNLTTNVFTVSSGTIPSTGSIVRYINATTVLTGLTLYKDYYLIKLTSSTFKLAETLEGANQGVAIDITAKGSGTNRFWMYDIIDYGQTYTVEAGAVALVGTTNMLNKDIIFGSDTITTAIANNANISLIVPELESRGYFVMPKIFSSEVTNTEQKLYIKHRPLKEGDSIIPKYRTRSIIGLPVTSPQFNSSDEATWGDTNLLTTASNLSDAKTFFDTGGELELEIVAGAGGGVLTKIENITESSGTYTITTKDDVKGASLGLKSFFIIDHWKELPTIDSNSVNNNDGYAEIPIGTTGSWVQFKIEMRGVDVVIEEIQPINVPAKKSV